MSQLVLLMIIALILAFLIGVFSVLLLEAFLLYKWWTSREADARNVYPHRTKVSNPEVSSPTGIIGLPSVIPCSYLALDIHCHLG